MVTDGLTDRAYWIEYWKNYLDEPTASEPILPIEILETVTSMWSSAGFPGPGSTFLEIGGFPGRLCAYFKKACGYNVTILDFVVVDDVLRRVERVNEIPQGSIKSIEAEFSTFRPEQKFDVVYSAGFIEHFADTKAVIEKHVACLNDGGGLFISLPNLRGLSGWVIKQFDRKTYDSHNISSMSIPFLREICVGLNLTSVSVFYFGRPIVYLDHPETVHLVIRKMIGLTSRIVSRLPWKTRWLSPHIGIVGRR
jgi:SAM-dependent methyltransferase